MEKLSLTEFKEYCAKISPKRYLFSSEYHQDNSPFGLEFTFTQSYIFMSVFLAPNAIALRNDENSQLIFECVKYINIGKKHDKTGIKCEIVCGNAHTPYCDTTYTIVII